MTAQELVEKTQKCIINSLKSGNKLPLKEVPTEQLSKEEFVTFNPVDNGK